MKTWSLLKKELNYYGIDLINSKKCKVKLSGEEQIQGVIKSFKQINYIAEKQQKLLLSLWNEVVSLLEENNNSNEIIDDKMIDLFIFSLKDMVKFLLCFEGYENTKYYNVVLKSLTRDINSFNKYQIYKLSDYKISIDWVNRSITKLLYISKLLKFVSMGETRISKYDDKIAGVVNVNNIKIAKGLAGPWSRLDLPLLERVFPFGEELQQRDLGKKKQRRYRKGLEEYNNNGSVGEGHYFRELRNEPFAWADRDFDDPYPSRTLLSR